MKFPYKILPFVYLFILFSVIGFFAIHSGNVALMNPKGLIAGHEKTLIVTAISLMLLVAIPAIFLVFFMAWRYREGNQDNAYDPEKTRGKLFQLWWWATPGIIILILMIITWNQTHLLDPYKPISQTVSTKKPILIQVVALRWKWLFLYPEQHIASVNFLQIPVDTPINFELTADAPMNSFWIPNLSGQIYAMTGMSTQLHIEASTPGDYPGGAAEINGAGFSGMRFVARASSESDFFTWVQKAAQSGKTLDGKAYDKLAKPSEDSPVSLYWLPDTKLYSNIVMKFMAPSPTGIPDKINMGSDSGL